MPTSRGPRRPAAEIRDEIRTAAVQLFLLNGYESTTLEQIGEQLGMTRPAVLYHFKSKEALLGAITDPLFEALDTAVETLPVVEHTTPDQRATALNLFLNTLIEYRCAAALVLRFTTANTVGGIGARARSLQERFAVALSGTSFETDPVVRVRTVACLSAATSITGARLPVDLTNQTERDALATGLLALLNA